MSYIKAYKTAKQMLEDIRSGRMKQESKAKGEAARADLEEGLVRRPQKTSAPSQPSVLELIPQYMEMASVQPQSDVSGGGKGQGGFALGQAVEGPAGAAREALAEIESSGNYQAKGKVMEKGMYKGQRALGRYQVMQGNIPSWTKAAMGREYSEEEFLANVDGVQDRVVEHQLQKSYEKYGTWEDAASVWFSGRPVSKAGNASDGNLTVPEYVSKFQRAFNKYATKGEG